MQFRPARIVAGIVATMAMLPASVAVAADGALDSVFDGDGKRTFEPATGASIADIAAFGDGRTVAVGEFQGGAEVAVMKRDGSLDSSFSNDGLATIPAMDPLQVAVGPGGTVALAGESFPFVNDPPDLDVARLDAAGDPDASFGGGDGVVTGVDRRDLDDIAVDSAGRLVVVGSREDNSDFEVTRFDTAGALDSTFAGDGTGEFDAATLPDFDVQFESAEAVAIQPDNKIVIAGGVDINPDDGGRGHHQQHSIEATMVVMRVTSAGVLDSTFAGGGGRSYPNIVTGQSPDCERHSDVLFTCPEEVESALSVAIEPDGQIAAAGYTDADPVADLDTDQDASHQEIDFAVAHLNANGTSDTGFSGDGRVSTPIAPNVAKSIFDADVAVGVAPGPGGSVVAAGNSTRETGVGNFDGDFAFVRYLANGTLDPAFDGSGAAGNGKFTVAVRPPSTESEKATSAALLPNGNVALAGGNINPEYGAIAVIRNDGTAPNTTIGSGPTEGSTIFTNKVSFTFSAVSEPAISTFECKYDAGEFVPCGSPYLKALADGHHIFNVRARDAAGNVDPSPVGRTFTVDATPPETTLTGNPGVFTADTTPGFTFTSTPAGGTFECAIANGHGIPEIDDSQYVSCTSGFSPPLADGEYTFEVRGSDGGGTDPTPAEFEFEVDTDAPDGVIVSAPGALIADRTPTFAVSTDEPLDIPEGEFTMTCALSGPVSPSIPCSDAPFEFAGNLPDGTYTFTLGVEDLLARSDASPATAQFTVDGTPPVTELTKKPQKRGHKRRVTFGFGSNETGATFQCNLDATAFSPCESPLKTQRLAFGKHTFAVVATDVAGNVDASAATWRFKVKRKHR